MITLSIALLLARVVVGLVMAAHGAQKLLGWFGGHGLARTGEFFGYLGFRPGKVFAAAAGLAEVTGGLLVTLGFLGPVGPAIVTSVMIVAMTTVHWQHGLFASDNGIEVPLLYITAAVSLALVGFGAYAVDAWLDIAPRWTLAATVVALGAGVAGALGALLVRRRLTAPAGA
jgi:putative oxidoreductase